MFFKFTQMATLRKGKGNLLGVKNRQQILFCYRKLTQKGSETCLKNEWGNDHSSLSSTTAVQI